MVNFKLRIEIISVQSRYIVKPVNIYVPVLNA